MFAIRRAREPSIEDLLGRTPVATDLEGVRLSLESHRVLVTGAVVPSVLKSAARSPDSVPPSSSSWTTTKPTFTTSRPFSRGRVIRPSSTSTTARRSSKCSSATGRIGAPHGRPQARSRAREPPGRGRSYQRVRNPQRDRSVGRSRSHPVLTVSSDKAVRHRASWALQAGRGAGAVEPVASERALLRSQVRNVLAAGGSVIPTFAARSDPRSVTVTDPRMTASS